MKKILTKRTMRRMLSIITQYGKLDSLADRNYVMERLKLCPFFVQTDEKPSPAIAAEPSPNNLHGHSGIPLPSPKVRESAGYIEEGSLDGRASHSAPSSIEGGAVVEGKCKDGCIFSRSINQEYPRKCLACGHAESQPQSTNDDYRWFDQSRQDIYNADMKGFQEWHRKSYFYEKDMSQDREYVWLAALAWERSRSQEENKRLMDILSQLASEEFIKDQGFSQRREE